MTFSLDHPHGYKLAGFPESEARIVARDGREPRLPLIVEAKICAHSSWIVLQIKENGWSFSDALQLINAPAPKRKVYMAMARNDRGGEEPYWSTMRDVIDSFPNRISPVVEVEIDV